MSKQPKKRVVIVCVKCGNEVTCSPGMAKYALEGFAVCAVEGCEGGFRPKTEMKKRANVP